MHHNKSPLQPPTRFYDLPNDVLLIIIDQLNQNDMMELSCVAKFISCISMKKLWHKPKCKTPLALKSIISTLNKATSTVMYPYHDWMFVMDISLENTMQSLADNTFSSSNALLLTPQQKNNLLELKTLRLAHVQASTMTSQFLINYFTSPNHIKEIQIINCSTEVTSSFITTQKYQKLTRVSIEDCSITDTWIQQIVNSTPQLKYFSIERSGYMISDAAIFAIAQHCPLIESLIVTLPSHLAQSNTITFQSMQSLSACIHLNKFVCRGQVRIANQECEHWLYSHCPKLEHVDLSF